VVIDIAEFAKRIPAEKARSFNALIENNSRNSEQYLRGVAGTFRDVSVKCTVEKGSAEEVIIEKAAAGQRHAYQYGHAWPFGDQPVAIGEYRRKGFARREQPSASLFRSLSPWGFNALP